MSSSRIKDLTLRWPRHRYQHVKKNRAWMGMAIKLIDVSIYCLHIMNCTLSQLLRCQRIIKCTPKAVCDLRQINIVRCPLNGMSRYGLNPPKLMMNPPKLMKNPPQQISHHAVSVSQPSRVKVDLLKQTCHTVVSIWGHDNPRQIQRIEMVSVVVHYA